MNILKYSTVVGLSFIALQLAACASTGPAPVAPPRQPGPVARPSAPPKAPEGVPTPGLTARQRMKLTIELLSRGDPVQARAEIQAFLLEQPDNDLGRSLLSQITEDPKVLLGAQSYAYTVQQGETLSMLADRYLDDRFKFYALARYNGIAVPSQSEVGQVIQIPGVPRRVADTRPRPRVAKSDDELIQQRLEAKRAATPPAAAKSTTVARNPARASQLRGSALELMSRGLIDQAVPLLRRALTFDPGNVVIQRDLDRAVRILSGIRPGG